MQESVVQTFDEGAVFRIILNRPAHFNAMNSLLLQRLQEVLDQAAHTKYRAVTITGAGKAFCAGGDVLQFAGLLSENEKKLPREMPDNLHLAIKKIRSLPKPVIALINGPCAGAGFSLSLACDYSMATVSAGFTLAYSSIGLSPDGGSTYFLPRILGFKKAMGLFLGGKTLSAQEALEMGLINQLCDEETFVSTSQSLVARLASGPTAAYAKAKELVNRSFNNTLEDQLELETDAICQSCFSQDFREGVTSFTTKRKPIFIGS
jgi:2-(1,2-epoxy-1,2-dihydrophenyl)acetyl-CoA isomerase